MTNPKRFPALVDSGFLYALFNRHDRWHSVVQASVSLYKFELIVPYVTLTEVAYMVRVAGGSKALAVFADALAKSQFHYEILTDEDFARISQISLEYEDARFDFVDCSIMALAERLNISTICTVDKRDFSIFRPRHCAYFELFP